MFCYISNIYKSAAGLQHSILGHGRVRRGKREEKHREVRAGLVFVHQSLERLLAQARRSSGDCR